MYWLSTLPSGPQFPEKVCRLRAEYYLCHWLGLCIVCLAAYASCLSRPTSSSDPSESSLETPFAKAFNTAQAFGGEKDLLFLNGRILWSFCRLVNFDALQDHHYSSEFGRLLYNDQGVDTHLQQLKNREELWDLSRMVWDYDEEPDQNEKRYFSCVGHEHFALSQHLTVMAGLNKSFLVDVRLWKWRTVYLNERGLYMYPSSEPGYRGRKRWICQSL